ncbi:hypothetical protein TV01_1568 [Neisseria flavescens]|nr:hypothetical protein TV01_1568 [Neisseria flavescens]
MLKPNAYNISDGLIPLFRTQYVFFQQVVPLQT